MTEKRYFKRMWEEEYYIFDSEIISENEFDEKVEYEDYQAFADSMQGDEVVELLNTLNDENEQLKQLLDYADDLIQSHLSEHYIRQWRNFKTGHKEYNDFWEEKLKKHKELKGDVDVGLIQDLKDGE